MAAKNRIFKQLDLCHVADGTIDEACHQRRVDIACMVGGENHGSLHRDVLAAIDTRAKDNVENQPKKMLQKSIKHICACLFCEFHNLRGNFVDRECGRIEQNGIICLT